jgi:hypothetical protein
MAVEPTCPACSPAPSSLRALRADREPRRASPSLTFTCRCGSAATVPTASGPSRELARLGWSFRFIAD